MIVFDNFVIVENFGHLFKNLGKIAAKTIKNFATNAMKDLERALKIAAKSGGSASF